MGYFEHGDDVAAVGNAGPVVPVQIDGGGEQQHAATAEVALEQCGRGALVGEAGQDGRRLAGGRGRLRRGGVGGRRRFVSGQVAAAVVAAEVHALGQCVAVAGEGHRDGMGAGAQQSDAGGLAGGRGQLRQRQRQEAGAVGV